MAYSPISKMAADQGQYMHLQNRLCDTILGSMVSY